MRAIAALSIAIVTILPSQTARMPLNIALMIDVSHSVTHPGFFKTDRALVPEAAAALASVLDPADRVRLGTFGTTITITPGALTGPAAIAQAADGFAGAAGGPSPLWDALDSAASALGGDPGRRAIIVVTDGRSTANRIGFAEILRRLEHEHLPVFVAALDLKRLPGPDPSIRLRQLADSTGGRYFFVKREGMGAGIKRAVAALRAA